MNYLSMIGPVKRLFDSLTEQNQKYLIQALLGGIATLFSYAIACGGVWLLADPTVFLQLFGLTEVVMIFGSLLIAGRIWDRVRSNWLRSDDFIKQRKFIEERLHDELRVLKKVPMPKKDQEKESKRIYREYEASMKKLEVRYLAPRTIQTSGLPTQPLLPSNARE